jgi:hypothetical protein
MKSTRLPLLTVSVLALAGTRPTVATAAEAVASDAVAVVASLSGRASVRVGAQPARDVVLFDWLPKGSVLETAKGGRLLLAFATGKRFEVGEGAKATLADDGFAAQSGPVKAAASVPPLPRLAPVAEGSLPTSAAGVVRIRGSRIAGLYPRAGTRVLHHRAVLRFTPVAGVERYRVDVEDDTGTSVFHAESDGAPVAVPPTVLKPAASYYWRVRGLAAVGAAPRGDEEFETLSASQAQARATVAEALEASEDADSLALLSAVDQSLGLLFEAQQDLRAALVRSPDHAGLRAALTHVEAEIGGR